MIAKVLSIQVGLPRALVYQNPKDGQESTWESGIFKVAVDKAQLGTDCLVGDGQSDLKHHGGPDRAVLIYPAAHYPFWEERLGRALDGGSFGENLTVSELTEETVCLGDVWEAAGVTIEISQPRLPCFKLARRLETPGLNVEVMNNGFGGFYARVVRLGEIAKGETLTLVRRPHPEWSSRRAFDVFVRGEDLAELRELAALPALSQLWKDGLARQLAKF